MLWPRIARSLIVLGGQNESGLTFPTKPTEPGVVIGPPIPDNEARQAVDSLAGYAYQLYQTLIAWLALGPDEFLFVEVAEDYAVATTEKLTATQVKATAANITLRTSSVTDAINAFWKLKSKNSGQRVTYRYWTTSDIGKEQGLSFPDGKSGLAYWREAARSGSAVKPIKDALLTLELDQEVKDFLSTATDSEIRQELVAPIHWDCAQANFQDLKTAAELQTAWRAEMSAQATVAEGRNLVLPLVAHLLSVATTKSLPRRLTSVDLDEFIQTRMTVAVPRRALTQLLGALPEATAVTDASFFVTVDQIPFPEPLLERSELIAELAPTASRNGILFIVGGSGKGKSTLARLVARSVGQDWTQIDFRGQDASSCNNRLSLAIANARASRGCFILDDVPIELDAAIETLLAVFARLVRSQDKLIIITTNSRPSARVLSLLGASDASVVVVPNLTNFEVDAAVQLFGGVPKKWGNVTYMVCGLGHPQLVMARLQHLAWEGWPDSMILAGMDPQQPAEEIVNEKASVRRRLIDELDQNALALVDRLSLIGLRFDRQMALAISDEAPIISNAGDALTELMGPWVEKIDHNFLRLSPLLMGAAQENLQPEQIKNIHGRAADEIMRRSPIEGSLLGQAFLHALAGERDYALARLAMLPVLVEQDQRKFVANELFALQHFRTDRLIRPSNPHVSVFLRLGQFRVCAEHKEWNLAEQVALRLVEEAEALPADQMRDATTAFVITLILSEQQLPRPIPGWFKLLGKYMDTLANATGPLADELRSRERDVSASMGLRINQFLFIFQSTRRSKIADLSELFSDLDATPAALRDELLLALDDNQGGFSTLVGNAWLGDAELGTLDARGAAQELQRLAELAERWGQTRLSLECIVAQSVMIDEYAEDPDGALRVIEDAENRLGRKVPLLRQRAKVLHRRGDHAGSLAVMRDLGDGLSEQDFIEQAFAYRSAGISAAELGDWTEAISFFSKARSALVKNDGDIRPMATGLLGDIAACEVHKGDIKSAIENIKLALEELAAAEPATMPDQLYTRHLIGHVPTWMDHELFGTKEIQLSNSLAPGKCSQPEPIPAVLDRPLYPLDVCWYQLARVEKRADVDAGVRSSIKCWPNSRKIAALEIVLANDDLQSAIRSRNLDEFVDLIFVEISAMAEMAAKSGQFRAEGLMNASKGTFPLLTAEQHETQQAFSIIAIGVFSFALSCVLAEDWEGFDALINLSDTRLDREAAFQRVIAELKGTSSSSTDNILVLSKYLHQLRAGEDQLTPRELFTIQCRLLHWLSTSNDSRGLYTRFSAFVRNSWRRIIDNQSFLLSSPMSSGPQLERALESEIDSSFSYAARVLLAANEAVGSPLSQDFRSLISDLEKQ